MTALAVIPSTACADDPDLFFDPDTVTEAVRLCAGCWFRQECAEMGERELHGVWGGVDRNRTAPPSVLHRWEVTAYITDNRDELVRRIRAEKREGRQFREIAADLGFATQTVRRLFHGNRAARRTDLKEAS